MPEHWDKIPGLQLHYRIFFNFAMNRTVTAFLAALVIILSGQPGMLSAQDLPGPLEKQIKRFNLSRNSLSLEVREMDSGRTVLSMNGNRPRNPASVIKILTSLSALEMLGPHFLWQTKYYLDGNLRDGVLNGDLVIAGSGDPFVTVDRFWHQVNNLRQRGIHTITGDLVIDNSLFQVPPHDPSAFDNRPSRLYNVGPDAAIINFSATRFVIQPVNGKIQIFADPPMAGLEIKNTVSGADGKCQNRNAGWKYGIEHKQGKIIASFSGTYRKRCGQHSISRAVTSNPDYTWRLFKYLWEQHGGTIQGQYRIGQVPESALELFTYPSEPLADIVTSINKYSNNVMSRNLFLTLDAQVENQPATIEGARAQLLRWLTVSGIPTEGLYVDNGSGLSRETRVTGSTLSAILAHAWKSNYRPEFLSSLSLSALDGTMRKRLKDSGLQGRARIKTGLLNGVRSMAGYVHARSGKHYSVVLMIESGQVTYSIGNEIQDALLQWIYGL